MSAQLAAQRLAAVQCCSWGHPVTSGFPTIDYFISSDLMEPADAADHYSERLIRLPNLSIYYEPAEVPPVAIDRAQLGLRASAVVYWCCQSLPKYLPQFDEVFARIAVEVPDCQFTFIEFGRRHAASPRCFEPGSIARSKLSVSTPEITAFSCRDLHRIVSSPRSVNATSCWIASAGQVATRSWRAWFTMFPS